MAKKKIASLSSELSLDTKKFTMGIKDATTSLDRFKSGAKKSFKEVGDSASTLGSGLSKLSAGPLAALAAVGVTVLGVTEGFSNAVEKMDEFSKLGRRLQIDPSGMQKISIIASKTGAELTELSEVISKLPLAFQDTKKVSAIESLGLDVEALKKMRPDEMFFALAKSISAIEDANVRASKASDIFGEQGLKILPVLNADADRLLGTFNKIGGALSGGDFAAYRKMQESIADMKISIEAVFMKLVVKLAPIIDGIANSIIKFIESMGGADKLSESILNAFKTAGDYIMDAWNVGKVIMGTLLTGIAQLARIAALVYEKTFAGDDQRSYHNDIQKFENEWKRKTAIPLDKVTKDGAFTPEYFKWLETRANTTRAQKEAIVGRPYPVNKSLEVTKVSSQLETIANTFAEQTMDAWDSIGAKRVSALFDSLAKTFKDSLPDEPKSTPGASGRDLPIKGMLSIWEGINQTFSDLDGTMETLNDSIKTKMTQLSEAIDRVTGYEASTSIEAIAQGKGGNADLAKRALADRYKADDLEAEGRYAEADKLRARAEKTAGKVSRRFKSEKGDELRVGRMEENRFNSFDSNLNIEQKAIDFDGLTMGEYKKAVRSGIPDKLTLGNKELSRLNKKYRKEYANQQKAKAEAVIETINSNSGQGMLSTLGEILMQISMLTDTTKAFHQKVGVR